MNTPLEKLVARLEAIAHKNDDSFRYRIEVLTKQGCLKCEFVCEESADGHLFVAGGGPTIEAAIENTTECIDVACSQWNYEQ